MRRSINLKMSESVVDVEEDDIYKNLPDFKYDDTHKKFEIAKKESEQRFRHLEKKIQEIIEENLKLKEENHKLHENISSLLKTANNELKRKDRVIEDLRKKNNQLIFRRKKTSHKTESHKHTDDNSVQQEEELVHNYSNVRRHGGGLRLKASTSNVVMEVKDVDNILPVTQTFATKSHTQYGNKINDVSKVGSNPSASAKKFPVDSIPDNYSTSKFQKNMVETVFSARMRKRLNASIEKNKEKFVLSANAKKLCYDEKVNSNKGKNHPDGETARYNSQELEALETVKETTQRKEKSVHSDNTVIELDSDSSECVELDSLDENQDQHCTTKVQSNMVVIRSQTTSGFHGVDSPEEKRQRLSNDDKIIVETANASVTTVHDDKGGQSVAEKTASVESGLTIPARSSTGRSRTDPALSLNVANYVDYKSDCIPQEFPCSKLSANDKGLHCSTKDCSDHQELKFKNVKDEQSENREVTSNRKVIRVTRIGGVSEELEEGEILDVSPVKISTAVAIFSESECSVTADQSRNFENEQINFQEKSCKMTPECCQPEVQDTDSVSSNIDAQVDDLNVNKHLEYETTCLHSCRELKCGSHQLLTDDRKDEAELQEISEATINESKDTLGIDTMKTTANGYAETRGGNEPLTGEELLKILEGSFENESGGSENLAKESCSLQSENAVMPSSQPQSEISSTPDFPSATNKKNIIIRSRYRKCVLGDSPTIVINNFPVCVTPSIPLSLQQDSSCRSSSSSASTRCSSISKRSFETIERHMGKTDKAKK